MDTFQINDKLMEQVEKAVGIFEAIYPHARGLFLFDNAPSHKKISDDLSRLIWSYPEMVLGLLFWSGGLKQGLPETIL